jgi:hypothetical protein
MKSFAATWFLIAGLWYAVNGILHDVFVIKNHSGSYDRELLRLLMDGHVLVLSGALMLVCWQMQRSQLPFSELIALIVSLGMILYCAMIFPFLKSFVTLLVSLVAAFVSFFSLLR